MPDICVYFVMPLVDEYQVQTYIQFEKKFIDTIKFHIKKILNLQISH